MSEDKSSKTEKPTDKKISKAREKGQFAKAPEINTTFILLGAFLVFAYSIKDKAADFAQATATLFGHLSDFELTPDSVSWGLGLLIKGSLKILFPILVTCFIMAILGGGVQSGFRLSLGVLGLKFERLSVVKGFGQIFSTTKLVQFGFDLLKLLFTLILLYYLVHELMSDPIFKTPIPIAHISEYLYQSGMKLLINLIGILAVISVVNIVYQKRKMTSDLMMSKQELKDERKSSETDPEIKRAQRQLAMRIMQKQMLQAIPTADVIVTNPTHYAIAIKYEREVDGAPVVIAKGKNHFARKILAIAQEHGVPRVENRPAARLLYKIGEVGKEIPRELYQVIAEILAYVYQKHRYYYHRLKVKRRENNK